MSHRKSQNPSNSFPNRICFINAVVAVIYSLDLHFLFVGGTEQKCHVDCHSSPRPVGPTRPWDSEDALRNPLHLTRPYPYHIAANDDAEDKYPFGEFCNLGCTYFFTSSGARYTTSRTNRTTLAQCIDQCDENYHYNITVGYNDLAEIARLECRDGCQMALKRCQPGYYCLQVTFEDGESSAEDDIFISPFGGLNEKDSLEDAIHYNGGDMIPCPPGSYRETSYDAVTECILCSPNYFREDVKGRSCSKCPAGTSAIAPGSTSIKDCVRCPAGTFSTEASNCICITPQACQEDQLPSPADSEKRDSVPYIGRW